MACNIYGNLPKPTQTRPHPLFAGYSSSTVYDQMAEQRELKEDSVGPSGMCLLDEVKAYLTK